MLTLLFDVPLKNMGTLTLNRGQRSQEHPCWQGCLLSTKPTSYSPYFKEHFGIELPVPADRDRKTTCAPRIEV